VSVAPTAGPLRGGTTVVITGRRLQRVTQVDFGTEPAPRFTVLSPDRIRATTPARASAASVQVTVRSRGTTGRTGCAGGCTAGFDYLPVPTLDGLMPTVGPVAGGTKVTIRGSGFTRGAAVRFGGVTLSHIVWLSDSALEVTTPPARLTRSDAEHPLRTLHGLSVRVVVATPGGRTVNTMTSMFTYL
jgi:hypothetical protein